jgi:D-alanyl-D-alanine carboxypeptidase
MVKNINKNIIYVIAVVLVASVGYGYFYINTKFKNTKSQLDSVVLEYQTKKVEFEGLLSKSVTENINLREALEAEQKKVAGFKKDINKITNTVDTLEKLSKTDPELLQKYSKVFFLNEHYAPKDVTDISKEYLADKNKQEYIHIDVWPYLENMLEDALNDDVVVKVVSGFRSFSQQSSLKNGYKVVYGAGTANQFSADQGYSEHQLGTAVDFSTPPEAVAFTNFESTAAYKWLLENAYKYGFVLSYPKGNVYYQFEPWHWRYVGQDLARYLHKKNLNFYDMDQRDINEYLVKIFD